MSFRPGLLRLLRRRRRRADGNAAVEIIVTTPLAGKFEFSADTYGFLETFGVAFLFVNRTEGDDGAATVQYATADGTAIAGVDYTAQSGTLSWAAEDHSTRSISIPILLTSTTGDFSFTVTLSNPTGGATLVSSPEVATVTIIRRGNGELAFPAPQWYKQEVNPGPSNVSLQVQRNYAFKGVVTCAWHTVDGDAIAGVDYTASSGVLTWTDGDGLPKTINVPVLYRAGVQADRHFTVVLDTPTGGVVLGSVSTADVLVSDNAVPANPAVTSGIPGQIIDEVYYSTADLLLADEGMYTNRNILVNVAHGRTLSRRFNGIFAFDANTAWAVGNLGYITKTSNGGTNWTQKTSGVNEHLYGVVFASASVGYAVGVAGTILKTTDGGDTWALQASGVTVDLYAVDFVSATTGWAVGDYGTILYTTDGGATWSPQTSGTSLTLRGVSALDANTVWTVGSAGVVLKTANAGATWSPQTSGVTVNLNGVSAVDGTHVWAVGNQGTIIFHNGTTWATQTSGVTTNLNAVSFASTTVGWAVGNTGTIRSTTDGSTWGAQTSAFTENLTSISAASTSTAYLTGHKSIQKTVNGGTNWTSSTTVDATWGFGGFSAGGAGSTGGLDILGRGDSFGVVSSRSFQGHVN